MTKEEIEDRLEAIIYMLDNGLIHEEMVEEAEVEKAYLELALNPVDEPAEDKINPKHYKLPISVFEDISKNIDAYEGFLHLNAVKYLHRCYHKHNSPVDDLKKAKWYIEKILEIHENNK